MGNNKGKIKIQRSWELRDGYGRKNEHENCGTAQKSKGLRKLEEYCSREQ